MMDEKIDELVINWHFTEACNYRCKYCFSQWERSDEVNRNSEQVNQILNNLFDYFLKSNPPLKTQLGYKSVRINFAGGEPMLLKKSLNQALVTAKQLGFKTSMITNGHFLVKDKIELARNSLDMVGISFDSQQAQIREKIGRLSRKGVSISCDEVKNALLELRQNQQGIKTKINTVVNQYNYQENFVDFINELNLDKWKVLQVLPFKGNGLLISKQQFATFVARHQGFGLPLFAESNASMSQSYLMIDPTGRFYQNTVQRAGYQYSGKINEEGVEKALSKIKFDTNRFKSRYQATATP